MWYVYGLICSDNSLYIGSTNDLKRRIKEHNAGMSAGIKGRLPAKLEFFLAVRTEKKAMQLEKYFKGGSGRAIIRKRILTDEA